MIPIYVKSSLNVIVNVNVSFECAREWYGWRWARETHEMWVEWQRAKIKWAPYDMHDKYICILHTYTNICISLYYTIHYYWLFPYLVHLAESIFNIKSPLMRLLFMFCFLFICPAFRGLCYYCSKLCSQRIGIRFGIMISSDLKQKPFRWFILFYLRIWYTRLREAFGYSQITSNFDNIIIFIIVVIHNRLTENRDRERDKKNIWCKNQECFFHFVIHLSYFSFYVYSLFLSPYNFV